MNARHTSTGVWRICIDTGGTFTDAIGIGPDGSTHRAKILSSSALRGSIIERAGERSLRADVTWNCCDDFIRGASFHLLGRDHAPLTVASFDAANKTLALEGDRIADVMDAIEPGAAFDVRSDEEAPVLVARLLTQTPAGDDLPPITIRLATTRGTNALLERRGAKIALFITEGFADLPIIGDQRRPDLFALNIERPAPLAAAVHAVPHRMAADGSVLEPLDEDAIRSAAKQCVEDGITVAAVALLHGYANPEHEQRIAELLGEAGFSHVSTSAELAPTIGLLQRTQTTTVDAYLSPVIASYLESVARGVGSTQLHVMTSAGGLVRADRYHAMNSLLSGPAGGVAGAAAAGRRAGFDKVIGFDMGGTSTDVCRFDGDFEYRFDLTVGGARIATPALAIETVAAGGGSVCAFEHGALRVGPHSAGADPGPACYGRGGPLALTDVNLLLGRLDADRFEIPIDRAAAEAAADELLAAVQASDGDETTGAISDGDTLDRDTLLEGLLQLADERMADAIAGVSVRRGFDPGDYALVSFGGAGGQHACRIAERLGMSTVIMPVDASLLSAVGLQHAVIERFAQKQVLSRLDDVRDELQSWIDQHADDARKQVQAEGIDADRISVRRRIVNLRLLGQDTSLSVECDDAPDDAGALADRLADAFAQEYKRTYGHAPADKPIEVESLRVVASSTPEDAIEPVEPAEAHVIEPDGSTRAYVGGRWQDVAAYQRDHLSVGDAFDGPAIVFDRRSTFVIEAGWSALRDAAGALVLRCNRDRDDTADASTTETQSAVVRRDLFMHRFTAIAEEMGQVLERTAVSTNVKERRDFSCALLDADGRLLVNAPHIPVHLGALGMCVRAVRDRIDMTPGDVIVTNHPAYGGSHLPDITVLTPIFANGDRLLGYAANRAHHAEIGGTRPGSMPPDATTLAEEGVVIEPMHLVRGGDSCMDAVERRLRSGVHPSRAIEDNVADLHAQVAANHRAADAMRRLADAHGVDEISAHMQSIFDRAVTLSRAAIAKIADRGDGALTAIERLDDGSPLKVAISFERGSGDADAAMRMTIDCTGSADQHAGNLNATPAIVTSAVLYVLRTLIGEQLPLSEGILDVVDLVLPDGSIVNPRFVDDPAACPAVVGGNIETSQRIVDTLLKALNAAACSQGTMNNVLFGADRFGYYETVCGGAGAGPGYDGASAVHTHMTNTAITDPEILEYRYPVRLRQFAIRHDSGGAGTHRGGDGVVREIEFLDTVALSILSQHRTVAPYGMDGGAEGALGRQRIVRADGVEEELGGIDGADCGPGDRLILETPGGGGCGAARDDD